MGTRGFRIVKFRGRYWIFYNHWDSYPEGLGKGLVGSIPTDPDGYRKWLQSQRENYAKWDSLLQDFLTIQPEDLHKLQSDEPLLPSFWAAFDERLFENAPPSYLSAFDDEFGIEWIYTIDLDQEVFSVDNGAHFRLDQIAKMGQSGQWIKALFLANRSQRFLLPHLVPAESVATLAIDPPCFTATTHYGTLRTRLVKPKTLDHISAPYLTGPRFRWMLFNCFQESQQEYLSLSLLGWQAQDLPFRELAFFILCLATGGENLSLVDYRSVKHPYSGSLYLGVPQSNMPESDIELATCLGVGYHMDGLPMGSAPEETKYWFEGALICLTPRLNHPGVLEKAIANAIEYGHSSRTRTSFNAVLISIEHLVLIRSFSDGSVDHTELLPLISITSHLSKDARARYGDQALDNFCNTRFKVKKPKGTDSNKMVVEQLSQDSDQQDSKDEPDCNEAIDSESKASELEE